MIAEALSGIRGELPEGVRLVAVSKFHPVSAIQEAYEAGQRLFGESHAQELQAKRGQLPEDIEWHFIGHLQTNKVKLIAPYVSLIHAVDTPRLLEEISRQALRHGRRIPCLLELKVAREATKYGFQPEECEEYLSSGLWRRLEGVRISGVMCMASLTEDERQIASEFDTARSFFLQARQRYFADSDCFRECSWGMSDDYPIALRHGTTMVRIGSKIFGERDYTGGK
ncbi:MAG: YggS family pyridoxal phosphate-dependent enzyme [Prevotellaceae bacterium]|nr:YggS family pyridoxal phosphate-dependent enzyme [Prevotellaceae bacterium]